jgi:integrase
VRRPPDHVVPVVRPFRVHGGDRSGELLALGWDCLDIRDGHPLPREGFLYLVLDRQTALPMWLLEKDIGSIREDVGGAAA